jgi:hypothetical protein
MWATICVWRCNEWRSALAVDHSTKPRTPAPVTSSAKMTGARTLAEKCQRFLTRDFTRIRLPIMQLQADANPTTLADWLPRYAFLVRLSWTIDIFR